jgi:ABC-type microcin C transport system permease subunit YejB
MARALIVIVAFLSIAVSAALAAPPADKGKPEKTKPAKTKPAKSESSSQAASDDKNAAKMCKAERGTTAESIAAFKTKYGTNHNKANAFGKCVSGKSKAKKEKDENESESEAEDAAEEAAAKKCKAERGTTSATIEAFKQKYGTNHNKANAFGKCVSKLAKAQTS